MAPHSSTLAWRIPWTEEPGRLQSMGSLRVGQDWATSLSLFTFLHRRRKWQPTPVFFAWRIPGMAEPGGLPSMGSHRVGHDWSDLAAAIIFNINLLKGIVQQKKRRGLNRGSLPILHIWFLCKNYGINQKLCHCTNRAIFLCHRMSVAPQKHKSYRSNVLKVLSTEGLSV